MAFSIPVEHSEFGLGATNCAASIKLRKLADVIICRYESGGSGTDGRAAGDLGRLAERGKN
jgi:hypothetical protein